MSVCETTRCYEWYFERLCSPPEENYVRDVGVANVASGFKPIDGEKVNAEFLGG